MKIPKRGGTWKKFWGGETKMGERFSKIKGGNPTFYAEFRDRKEQIWGLLETNYHKCFPKFAWGSNHYNLFGHLLCISCLNSSKECFYSGIYIKDDVIFKIWFGKSDLKFGWKSAGNQYFKLEEKRAENQNFAKILGGESLKFLRTEKCRKSIKIMID